MKKGFLITLLAIVLFNLTGCKSKLKKDYSHQLGPGEYALRKITDPALIPDISAACTDLSNLREAAQRSINYLNKPSSEGFFPSGQISHEMGLKSLEELVSMLDSGLSGDALNAAIKDKFDFYISVGCDNEGTVLFTGYFTPIFDGSQQQGGRYQYPLYKMPADLVKGDNGVILGRQMADGTTVPYPDRREIEQSNMLAGSELVWLTDPFEVYIAHVQGSAKIRLQSGELITVGYAANNGYEYHSISKDMVDEGVLSSDQLSLMGMIEYFKSHPDQVSNYVQRNPRFVFFRNEKGEPRGSLNEEVTPYRSIATDKTIFPRGCFTFIDTALPDGMGGNREFKHFGLDQDTGGAIRAAGRCDVYIGQGDDAGRIAGDTYQEGKLYYMFLKDPSITY